MKYTLKIIAIVVLAFSPQTNLAQRMKLFNNDIRAAATHQQLMVMDFMERYFPMVISKGKTAMETKMADDKVYFRKGTPQNLYQVTDTMPVSLLLDDRFYQVTWSKGSKPFITVVFPAQYDLIMGMQQDEAQKNLKDDICNSEIRSTVISIPDNLKEITDGVFISKSSHMELESLNNATYYRKINGRFIPLFDDNYKEYSAANLLQGLITDIDYPLYVEQSVYGMKTTNFSITLSQWLNYCALMGLDVYFGVEEEREDGLLAVVIAHSNELGFNHMLSIVLPDTFIKKPKTILKARLTSYIPTHNLKSLYQKEAKKTRKIWQ